MSLFVFNPFRIGEELTPPQMRQPVFTAWVRVLLRPLKWLTDLFLIDYCAGTSYASYSGIVTYTRGNRITWVDNCIYELRVTSSLNIKPTGHALSPTNWYKILNDFIGVDERSKYTGQLIVFEYAINRRFQVTSAPYIYCTAVSPPTPQINIVINVPLAVYTSLGATNPERKARVVQFAEKYIMGGLDYSILTY